MNRSVRVNRVLLVAIQIGDQRLDWIKMFGLASVDIGLSLLFGRAETRRDTFSRKALLNALGLTRLIDIHLARAERDDQILGRVIAHGRVDRRCDATAGHAGKITIDAGRAA